MSEQAWTVEVAPSLSPQEWRYLAGPISDHHVASWVAQQHRQRTGCHVRITELA